MGCWQARAAQVRGGQRLQRDAPRTAALRVDPPPPSLEKRLGESLDPEGSVLDGASKELARARRAVRETRQRLVAMLDPSGDYRVETGDAG